MSARPWGKVNDFYLDMVKGRTSLPELFGKEKIPVAHLNILYHNLPGRNFSSLLTWHSDRCINESRSGNVVDFDDEDEEETGNKPTSFHVSSANHLLHQLEGKLLFYRMFARDTKASRNMVKSLHAHWDMHIWLRHLQLHGPPTESFVFHARAAEILLPCAEKDGTCVKMMCIELVANRFPRKMVRVLAATAVREAAAGAEEDALLKLIDATCRRATAPPAPRDGLCLVDAGYTEFDKKSCLIP
ncbi:unnamed protein product [Fraxinus pennsylvanica]|uniref:tRNA pseudouridine synthase n=1 Tax=Fraxinus pennsylvanica TaxID=56036 RepID=A0AAD2A2K9_9LAMI|nr:unnamed protein product [Fraxinus pennsylvanica]